MAEVYDTAKLRDAADQVAALAALLEDDAERPLRETARQIEDWRGLAADACRAHVDDSRRAIGGGADKFRRIEHRLRALADAIDEVDRRLADELRGG